MRLAKLKLADGSIRVALLEREGAFRLLDLTQVARMRCLMDVLNSNDPIGLANFLVDRKAPPLDPRLVTVLAPIDEQEVWAAGVTYKRSQVARMEESKAAASHYDKVYTAPRPEIFFKATANRVSGPDQPLRVRADSGWSVPEPELALVISSRGTHVGFTIGNDMSARDIEGENPLYLPQAKLYNQCCGLGPFVWIPEEPLDRPATKIKLTILRAEVTVFQGQTDLDQMQRGFDELIGWLIRENDLVCGAFLLTGTGVVPPDAFTLNDGDKVSIEITGIGTLNNPIVKASPPQ